MFEIVKNTYRPEGFLIGTAENREFLSSSGGIERAMASGKILEGMAIVCDSSLTLTVDLNLNGKSVKGIIPKSEVLLCNNDEAIKDIAVITRVGKAVCFKVIDIIKEDGEIKSVLLSRRAAQLECMNNYILRLSNGDIIDAKVTHMEHFGAFTDVGCGIISLMPIDSISVSRISHPKDRFHVGMHIKAVVKSLDYDTGRMYLTHKELLGTWKENADLFSVGQTVAGIVRSIEDYGVFVELTPNLAGLAENNIVSSYYNDSLTVGQTAAVYIKNIIPERMKIKLVLIDSYRGELSPCKMVYRVEDDCSHIDSWRYSPRCCEKLVSSVF